MPDRSGSRIRGPVLVVARCWLARAPSSTAASATAIGDGDVQNPHLATRRAMTLSSLVPQSTRYPRGVRTPPKSEVRSGSACLAAERYRVPPTGTFGMVRPVVVARPGEVSGRWPGQSTASGAQYSSSMPFDRTNRHAVSGNPKSTKAGSMPGHPSVVGETMPI